MDILPSGNIFRELQDIQDFGYFSSQSSIEDQWQQASPSTNFDINIFCAMFLRSYSPSSRWKTMRDLKLVKLLRSLSNWWIKEIATRRGNSIFPVYTVCLQKAQNLQNLMKSYWSALLTRSRRPLHNYIDPSSLQHTKWNLFKFYFSWMIWRGSELDEIILLSDRKRGRLEHQRRAPS
jgi:hypothetical protein